MLRNQKALQQERLQHLRSIWYDGRGPMGEAGTVPSIDLSLEASSRQATSWFSGSGLAARAHTPGVSAPVATKNMRRLLQKV